MRATPTSGHAAERVSCVIPVYNEAARIARVLAAVVGHPLVGEVIVVDDASTDGTGRIVEANAGARLLRLERNQGKSGAVCVGLQAAANRLVLLVDGDLTGLTADHVTALIRPVMDGRADIAISLRENTPKLWKVIGLDYVSGERVFSKDLVKNRWDAIKRLPRFGFEVYLNRLLVEGQCRIAIVQWRGVRSPLKSAKYGFAKGILADLRMLRDLFRSASPIELLNQILAMLRLRVKTPAGR